MNDRRSKKDRIKRCMKDKRGRVKNKRENKYLKERRKRK